VRKEAERLGITLGETVLPHAPDRAGISDDFARARDSRARLRQRGDEPAAFTPGRGSPRVPSCYVSYAWSDGTAQADANARMVDDLCAAAAARGIAIIRDQTDLASGESITAFNEEIARAERVVTLIGARYWTRPDCFAELYGCWIEARQRPELFRQTIREFIFSDAGLYDPAIVQKVAQHWEAEFARCDAMPGAYRDRHAALIADHADSWATQARRIIGSLQDRVRPYEGNFEAFKDELFAELENLRYRPDDGPYV
jgi:hypothetical protein